MTDRVDETMLLVGLAVIVLVCQVAARVARRLGQPPVVGEIVGGILLGPTLFDGHLGTILFPAEMGIVLDAFADIGVVVFMFLVGLEFDRRVLRGHATTLGLLGAGSLVVPFGLGALLALWLAERHPTPDRVTFVVFVGTAMAVTALPVLARIIVDRGMLTSRVGSLALTLAAIGDLVAWTVLALVVAAVGSETHSWRLLLLVPYGLVMALVVPHLLRRLARVSHRSSVVIPVVVALVFASASATEWMGLHLIFGAFVAGLVVPGTGRDGGVRERASGSLQPLASCLMPIYFVVAGLQVDLFHLEQEAFIELALILVVAFSGKMIGVYGAARAAQLEHRDAGALATLMNARGLTELVLLTVGLTLGIIDQALYSLMVIMTVATTVICGPLLRVFLDHRLDEAVVITPERVPPASSRPDAEQPE